MKLLVNQQAPDFSTTDIYGYKIDLKKLTGQKTYLAFERNAGCPVCNLRTHELLKQSEYFKTNNIVVIMIYESTLDKMKEYLGNDIYPFHFVADPENALYKKYGVEQSLSKMLKGLFHGLMDKANQEKKLFKRPIKQDGHPTRIPSEFIVNENGFLSLAHYGRFIGDHVPLENLKTLLVK